PVTGIRASTLGTDRTTGPGDQTGPPDIFSPKQLESIGMTGPALNRLLSAASLASEETRDEVAQALSSTIALLVASLQCPLPCAVIPAAGGQHRLLAPNIMQRLLLLSVVEAVHAGIREVVLVLPPGKEDSLFQPLQDAVSLYRAPKVQLRYVTQARSEGL